MFAFLFRLLNILIFLLWVPLLAIPRSVLARKIIKNLYIWISLGLIYFLILFLYGWEVNWVAILNPTVESIGNVFKNTNLGAIAWIHILILNLFVGRWIAVHGFKRDVMLFPFLLLSFLSGPLGLAAYLLFCTNVSKKA